ncbi:hypothetical protein V8B97DRAFT_292484 [Scleroderma yunnanense]
MGRGATSAEARGTWQWTNMPPLRQRKEGCSWVQRGRDPGTPFKRKCWDRRSDEDEDEAKPMNSGKDLARVTRSATSRRRTNDQQGNSDTLQELTGVLTRVSVATEAIRDALLDLKAESTRERTSAPEVVLPVMGSEWYKEKFASSPVSETPEPAAGPSSRRERKGKKLPSTYHPMKMNDCYGSAVQGQLIELTFKSSHRHSNNRST